MRTILNILLPIVLFTICSCERNNEIISETEKTSKIEMLTNSTRKLTKAVLVNEVGLEADFMEDYTVCDLQTTYTYYYDSIFVKSNTCYDFEITETWIFNTDSTSLLHFRPERDTTEYKIIELTSLKLKVEQLSNDLPENLKMIFTYEPVNYND